MNAQTSTSTPYRLPPRITRSRGGCQRCRKRRQRCNQKRPSCDACVQAETACRYELKLNWGGRSFRKSPFGKYLDDVERLGNTSDCDGFVYCLPEARHRRRSAEIVEDQASLEPVDEVPQYQPQSHPTADSVLEHDAISADPDVDVPQTDLEIVTFGPLRSCSLTDMAFPSNQTLPISMPAQYLFQFYFSETMRLTVPSSLARTQICRFLVPAAVQQPCLLYAIMAFAAIHLEASGKVHESPKRSIDMLQWMSMRHLQLLLANNDEASKAIALATTRTLCQAEIYGGTSSWRVHLNGARAILESSHFQNPFVSGYLGTPSNASFLSSWYNNAEALAALSPNGLLRGQLETIHHSPPDVYFDIFGGVMSDLPDLFREVGALVKESRRRRQSHASNASILSETDILQEAEALTREIYYRLQRDSTENLSLNPDLHTALSASDIQDYSLSNAGYLYTALLHIQCGVQLLSPFSEEIQFCVEQIVRCAELMTKSSGLSPRVLLVAPLFTAGLCAIGSVQDTIRSALEDIGKWMRTPHLINTLALLEYIWQQPLNDSKNIHIWSRFNMIDRDFIPY